MVGLLADYTWELWDGTLGANEAIVHEHNLTAATARTGRGGSHGTRWWHSSEVLIKMSEIAFDCSRRRVHIRLPIHNDTLYRRVMNHAVTWSVARSVVCAPDDNSPACAPDDPSLRASLFIARRLARRSVLGPSKSPSLLPLTARLSVHRSMRAVPLPSQRNAAAVVLGPGRGELRDLGEDFRALRERRAAALRAAGGCFPGEAGHIGVTVASPFLTPQSCFAFLSFPVSVFYLNRHIGFTEGAASLSSFRAFLVSFLLLPSLSLALSLSRSLSLSLALTLIPSRLLGTKS
jgi:hypothetical protein